LVGFFDGFEISDVLEQKLGKLLGALAGPAAVGMPDGEKTRGIMSASGTEDRWFESRQSVMFIGLYQWIHVLSYPVNLTNKGWLENAYNNTGCQSYRHCN
jgi:hypothetical protein